jgi:hypothetical protein
MNPEHKVFIGENEAETELGGLSKMAKYYNGS